jgi:hypothetical protein
MGRRGLDAERDVQRFAALRFDVEAQPAVFRGGDAVDGELAVGGADLVEHGLTLRGRLALQHRGSEIRLRECLDRFRTGIERLDEPQGAILARCLRQRGRCNENENECAYDLHAPHGTDAL